MAVMKVSGPGAEINTAKLPCFTEFASLGNYLVCIEILASNTKFHYFLCCYLNCLSRYLRTMKADTMLYWSSPFAFLRDISRLAFTKQSNPA